MAVLPEQIAWANFDFINAVSQRDVFEFLLWCVGWDEAEVFGLFCGGVPGDDPPAGFGVGVVVVGVRFVLRVADRVCIPTFSMNGYEKNK